jgi:STE24 endopeptidase
VATVSLVRHYSRYRAAGSLLGALAAAELGARLLSPRQRAIEPAEVDLRDHFSPAEIRRGSAFARPQLAIGLARSVVDLAALGLAARMLPGALPRRLPRPVAAGALTGAGLALAGTLPSLPLAVLSRRRAIAVGLVTQSWRGWAGDLAKSTAIGSVLSAGAGAAARPPPTRT